MEGRLVQLNFSAVYDKVSHRSLLYKLRSIGVEEQFFYIMSVLLSDRRHRVRFDGKTSASLYGVSGMPQGSVLGLLLHILYTSELFHILGNHIMGYADDATIYAVIPRMHSRLQVLQSLNQALAAIDSWYLKRRMRLNPKKMKSIVASRFRTNAHGYGDLTLGGAELEKIKSLRILMVTFELDIKLTFETHLREVESKATISLGVVRRTRKLLDCSLVPKSCFNAYILFSFEHYAPVWMSLAESHLGLLGSIVRSAERLRKSGLCCFGHKRKVSALCLLYRFYHRVGHSMNEHLNNFVAARNTRALDAIGELVLVIPRCRTDQFSRSLLPAVLRLWNLLPSGVFSGDT